MNTNIKSLRTAAVAALLLVCGGLFAQTKGTGTVVDKDGFPIAGVSVKAGSTTVTSDLDGQFALDPSATLILEKEGYLPQSVKAADKMTVVLEEDENEAEINLRNDIQRKFGLTAAVSTITSSDFKDGFNGNIYSSLSGKLAGLAALTKTGVPTDEVDLSWTRADKNYRMYIRGLHSSNHADPAIYVDGIRSQLTGLMPAEIESISVLKDAAALSLFGMDGGDGVIYITTKRGQEGKNRVNIDVQHGCQQLSWMPDFVDSYDYASLYNEARRNDGMDPFYTAEQMAVYKSGNQDKNYQNDLLYPNVNWYEETLKKLAPTTVAQATFSGGSKHARYFAMLGYQDVEGFYDGTDKSRNVNSNISDRRYNFRVNMDVDMGKIFYVKSSVSGIIIDDYRPNADNSLWTTMHVIPALAMPATTPEGYGASPQFQKSNPMAQVLETGYVHLHSRNLNANVTFGQNLDFITKGLRLEESAHMDNNHQFKQSKTKDFQTFYPTLVDGAVKYTSYGQEFNNFSFSGLGGVTDTDKNRIQLEATASYNRTFGASAVNAFVTFHNDKYTADGKQSMPLINRGFYGKLGYSYNDKFFAEFGWSYGGLSYYNPECNTGFFPSLSLGYIFVNDPSLNSNVNFFKVRASSGITGYADYRESNIDGIGGITHVWKKYYQFVTIARKFAWGGNTVRYGNYESFEGNPIFTWEKHWINNLGFDMRFFGNRLSLNADFFFEDATDIRTTPNTPGYYGILATNNDNAGEIYNMGTELTFGWNDKIGDFSYGINGNFSFARNKIIFLNEVTPLYDYQSNVGTRIDTPLTYLADGFYKTDAEAAAANSLIGEIKAGDIKYVDLNNDGQIDGNDMTFDNGLYSKVPEISYGINFDFGYKAFDLNIGGYGFANRSVNTYNEQTYAFNGGFNNVSSLALGRWAYDPAQGIDTRETATYPRLTLGSNASNTQASTFWYKNGGFFRISNISLGYTIDRAKTAMAGIDKVRFYLAVSNPFVIDSIYEDPETIGNWPLARVYKIGINFNF